MEYGVVKVVLSLLGIIVASIMTEYVSIYLLNKQAEVERKRSFNWKVSLLMMVVYGVVWYGIVKENWSWYYIIVTIVIGISVWTDMREHFIFNKVTYPFMVATLVYILYQGDYISILVGLGFLLFFGLMLLIVPGGMGLGDIKLFIPLFMVMGIPNSLIYLFITCVIGLLHHGYVIWKEKKKRAVPFGFSIGVAYVVYIYFVKDISEMLFSLMG